MTEALSLSYLAPIVLAHLPEEMMPRSCSKRSSVGALLAAAVLVAACGSGDEPAPATAPSPDTAVTASVTAAPPPETPRPASDPEVPPTDYLTFAHGAIPLAIGGAGAEKGADFTHAVQIIDGSAQHFTFTKLVPADLDTEFIYELPAPTTFTRFAVPNVNETPSPSQTFTKEVAVFGSASGADGPWTRLASATLETHQERGQETELALEASPPVRWIRLRLVGGIEVLRDQMFFEFSEIIGNGTQEVPDLAENFSGIWAPKGPPIELAQEGATVTGCYDRGSELAGTVTGNIVRASGIAPDDSVRSVFILSVLADGTLRGVRSTNGAPFRLYTGPPAREGTNAGCAEIPPPALGCGSIIHGITFGFDSAEIRPDSEPVLADLFDGLQADAAATIVIEGHTSSEGSDAYNQALSERRAQAVVDDLVRRGLDASRLRAVGRGEANPIAPNDDESGRSLNRRVEIECS